MILRLAWNLLTLTILAAGIYQLMFWTAAIVGVRP